MQYKPLTLSQRVTRDVYHEVCMIQMQFLRTFSAAKGLIDNAGTIKNLHHLHTRLINLYVNNIVFYAAALASHNTQIISFEC